MRRRHLLATATASLLLTGLVALPVIPSAVLARTALHDQSPPATGRPQGDRGLSGLSVDPMFQDHAVLQRGQPLTVWGLGTPGTEVSVTLGTTSARSMVMADSRWSVILPEQTAGGPHDMTIRASDGSSKTLSDLKIGDVWLCSGQSNMEFEVRQAAYADAEVPNAADSDLRLFLVARSSLTAPSTSGEPVGRWQLATPESVARFSAACYFMGRDLRRTETVPIGLIAASWGGSIIEDWISREALLEMGGHDDSLIALDTYARNPSQGWAAWQAMNLNWWHDNDAGSRQGWHLPGESQTGWAPIAAEGFWENTVPALQDFNGIVWIRKEIRLTPEQARQSAVLELGPVDDIDVTWINGHFVGGREGWNVPRTYQVPPGVLIPGRNLITVGMLDIRGFGGAWGTAADKRLVFSDGSRAALATGWQYQASTPAEQLPPLPRVPWIGGSGTTTLYNGMIAPLGPYGLKGMAWYQGESNVGDPEGYSRLLKTLFEDRRSQFRNPRLQMLVVQLANFGAASSRPGNSGWAALRESQRTVVNADPMAGLAIAIDIGDRFDIHPTNKQDVGRRLALEARRLDGRPEPTSPQPIMVERGPDGIHVRYAAGTPLSLTGYDRPIGFELCEADDVCRYANATLSGETVILADSRPTDVKVRLCWADNPVCNLLGPSGLPAVPFEASIR